jgi:predicted dehydrogenase
VRDQVNFGLVGLGYWGPNHLRVLMEREDAQPRWLCDLDRENLRNSARRCPSARSTTRIEELLRDPDLDAVIISTPISTHFELGMQALRAGKHVLIEKPLAARREEAEALAEVAHERDLALMCGHTFLFSPPVRAVHRLIEEGQLGDLYFVSSSRVNLGLHQADVSVLWDLAPHDFSILRYWLGSTPAAVSAVGRDSVMPGIPDVAFINLWFESGLMANVELSWLAPSKLRRTVVVGSEKMVVYEDGAAEQVRVFDRGVLYKDPETFGEFQLAYRTGDIVSPRLDPAEPIAVQLEEFIDATRRGSTGNGHLALCCDVVAMVEAAQASLEQGGQRVSVEAGLHAAW